MITQLPGREALLALVVVGVWGMNFIAIKWGVSEFPPMLMTSIRFMLVSVLILPFAWPKREHLKTLLVFSVTMGGLHFCLLFIGFSGVNASAAAVASQMNVPFSVLIGILAFKEKTTLRKAVGVGLGFAGVLVLAGEPGHTDPLYLSIVIMAAFFWSLSSALFKVLPPVPSMTYIGGIAAFAVPQTLLASWLLETGQVEAIQNASIYGWGGIIYTVIGGSIIGHGLWYGLAQRNDLSLVVPFTLLCPVIGIAASVVILGDIMTVEKTIGAALTLTGVAILQFSWSRFRLHKPKPLQESPHD